LARKVAAEAAAHPERFSELARKYSEDVTTQATGGSFGGVPAATLYFHPQILDALAALPPGGVSDVVSTNAGYHIFMRNPPPPQSSVSGARIVIGYVGAGSLSGEGGSPPSRSRSEAVALADGLARQLQQNPAQFDEFVQQYSDHPDKAWHGDLGSWSTWEPTVLSREVEVLRHLTVGQVSSPVDSQRGIEILRRTTEVPRPTYAVEVIRVPFDPASEAHQRLTLEKMNEMAQALQRSPQSFDEVRTTYCCRDAERWSQGRMALDLVEAVSGLAVGEIARAPLREFNAYTLPRRIDAQSLPEEPEALLELPSPPHADIMAAVVENAGEVFDPAFRAALLEARSQLPLTDEEQRMLAAWTEPLPELRRRSLRAAMLRELQREATLLLGPDRYATYTKLVQRQFDRFLMGRELVAVQR